MEDAPEESKEGQQSERRLVNWKLVDRMVRTSLAAFLFLFLAALVLDFFEVSLWQTASKVPSESASTNRPMADFLFASDFQAGNWSIGQSDWDFSTRQLEVEPSEVELTRLPSERRTANNDFKDGVFVDLFSSLSAKKTQVKEITIWTAQYNGRQMVLFTDMQNGNEVVQGFRVCYPDGDGFSLINGQPTSAVRDGQAYLLPLCEGAQQLACRRSESGIVSSAIVDYSGKNVDILQFWKDDGWIVTNIADNHDASGQYVCRKNGVEVAATLMTDEHGTKIMLVRVPDSPQPVSQN